MTESELYQRHLKPMFKKLGLFQYRFELARIPDLYLYRNGSVLWAELKVINSWKSNYVAPKWRPGQFAWIRAHELYGEGGVCLILYYNGEIYFLPPQLSYTKEELICQKNHYLKKLVTA